MNRVFKIGARARMPDRVEGIASPWLRKLCPAPWRTTSKYRASRHEFVRFLTVW